MGAIIGLSAYFPDIGLKCHCEKALIILNARPGKYMAMSLAFRQCSSSSPLVFPFGSRRLFPFRWLCWHSRSHSH